MPASERTRTSMRAVLSSAIVSGTVSLKSLRPITQRLTCSVRKRSAVDADLDGDLRREALRRPGRVDEDPVRAADPVGAHLRERERRRRVAAPAACAVRAAASAARASDMSKDAPHMLSAYPAIAGPNHLPRGTPRRMSEIVQSERHGAVALLRLNRPEALNALSDEVLGALCAALDDAEDNGEVRCVVLCGAGRAFAAGADVAGLRAMSPDEVLAGERGARWQRLRAARVPVIAAVHGWCLGGGCELALTCDIVIAAEDARFGLPETGLGLIPGAGGTQRLPRVAGRSLALEMILGGRTLSAQRGAAARHLLARRRARGARARGAGARSRASRTARRSPCASRARRSATPSSSRSRPACARSAGSSPLAFASDDAREGMDAFVARRTRRAGVTADDRRTDPPRRARRRRRDRHARPPRRPQRADARVAPRARAAICARSRPTRPCAASC